MIICIISVAQDGPRTNVPGLLNKYPWLDPLIIGIPYQSFLTQNLILHTVSRLLSEAFSTKEGMFFSKAVTVKHSGHTRLSGSRCSAARHLECEASTFRSPPLTQREVEHGERWHNFMLIQ